MRKPDAEMCERILSIIREHYDIEGKFMYHMHLSLKKGKTKKPIIEGWEVRWRYKDELQPKKKQ